jgi:hypothetical protein
MISCMSELPYSVLSALLLLATAVNDVTSAYILNFVLNKFPRDVSAFHSSLGYEIVSRLSRSLSNSRILPTENQKASMIVVIIPKWLPAYSKTFLMLLQPSFFEEAESSNRKTMQKSKTSRRKAMTGMYAEINDRLFRALGPQVPRTRESAEEMIKSVFDSQKDTLRVSTLSSAATLVEALLIFRPVLFHPASTPRNCRRLSAMRTFGGTAQGGEWTPPTPETGANPIHHRRRPIQADLYFPSAAGFGQWRILCSRVPFSAT